MRRERRLPLALQRRDGVAHVRRRDELPLQVGGVAADGIVVEDWPEPALGLLNRPAFAGGIILNLVAAEPDILDVEVIGGQS